MSELVGLRVLPERVPQLLLALLSHRRNKPTFCMSFQMKWMTSCRRPRKPSFLADASPCAAAGAAGARLESAALSQIHLTLGFCLFWEMLEGILGWCSPWRVKLLFCRGFSIGFFLISVYFTSFQSTNAASTCLVRGVLESLRNLLMLYYILLCV